MSRFFSDNDNGDCDTDDDDDDNDDDTLCVWSRLRNVRELTGTQGNLSQYLCHLGWYRLLLFH